MTTSFLPRLSFLLATAASALTGCAGPGPATETAEGAISNNLVTTTYHDCQTGELVGEKIQGCVVGTPAQWGSTTVCYEIDSDTCDTAEPIQVKYCAFDNACDAFVSPDAPDQTYEDWLAAQR